MLSIRPAVVHTWMLARLADLGKHHLIPCGPVHAKMLSSVETYTKHFATFLTVDRTPLPFSYVQMTCLSMLVFVTTLPLALTSLFGWGTPIICGFISYCYAGLYINGCTLRNPFNYDKTLTGLPINAFIQRIEKQTEAILMDVSQLYNSELPSSPRTIFRSHSRRNLVPPSPASSLKPLMRAGSLPLLQPVRATSLPCSPAQQKHKVLSINTDPDPDDWAAEPITPLNVNIRVDDGPRVGSLGVRSTSTPMLQALPPLDGFESAAAVAGDGFALNSSHHTSSGSPQRSAVEL